MIVGSVRLVRVGRSLRGVNSLGSRCESGLIEESRFALESGASREPLIEFSSSGASFVRRLFLDMLVVGTEAWGWPVVDWVPVCEFDPSCLLTEDFSSAARRGRDRVGAMMWIFKG